MKKVFLLFAFLLFISIGKAQRGFYNYQEFGIGMEASSIRGFTNVPNQNNHSEFNLNLIYNYNPYLPISAEFQTGQLSGGGLTSNLDKYGRMFDNHYKAFILHGDIQLGAAIDYSNNSFLNFIKNIYAGIGIGVISNSVQAQRYSIYDHTYKFPGNNNAINMMIPIRFGYEIKINDSYGEPGYAIDLGYVHNIVLGGGLDGYNDPSSKFKNNALDQYRQILIGFKYFFGNVVSYNKAVRY